MSSFDRFVEERKRYKRMFEEKLIEILKRKEIQYMLEKFKVSQYQFMIAQPRHFNAVKHLMIEQYQKTNPIQIVFDSTFELPMVTAVTAKVDAGRCIIAVDKGNIQPQIFSIIFAHIGKHVKYTNIHFQKVAACKLTSTQNNK